MENNNKITITLGGTEYELILTTGATQALAERYGGLEKVGEAIAKKVTLSDLTWMITLLANQGIRRHNLMNASNPRPLLTEEQVELLTVPTELTAMAEKLVQVLYRDTGRVIESAKN